MLPGIEVGTINFFLHIFRKELKVILFLFESKLRKSGFNIPQIWEGITFIPLFPKRKTTHKNETQVKRSTGG